MLLLRGDDFNIKKYHLQSTLEVVLLEIDTLERRQNRRAKYRAPWGQCMISGTAGASRGARTG